MQRMLGSGCCSGRPVNMAAGMQPMGWWKCRRAAGHPSHLTFHGQPVITECNPELGSSALVAVTVNTTICAGVVSAEREGQTLEARTAKL